MPALVAATDVMVQNAGGLTSLEALRCGVPVLSYRCIPGHGRTNAAALSEAGLARWVHNPADLATSLHELTAGLAGRRQIEAGLALEQTDPADVLADRIEERSGARTASATTRRANVRVRLAAAAAVLLALMWMATDGTRLAVAHGLDAVDAKRGPGLYLVLHPHGALDPSTIKILASLQVAVALDESFIVEQPDTVRRLAASGVVLVNAGYGPPYRTGVIRGRLSMQRAARAISQFGVRPRLFVSRSDVDAVDVGILRATHEVIMVPDQWSADGRVSVISAGQIVLAECSDGRDCLRLATTLAGEASSAAAPLRSLHELEE
jgi:hypothetical protein